MKLEIGGGRRPRGQGFVNVDLEECADIRHDLNHIPWPIDDDTVDEVYSSHCIEHLKNPFDAFDEICRVCRVGAHVELRVPFPLSDHAMTHGHIHVFSPLAAINMERFFPKDFWRRPKRLKLIEIKYGATILLEEAKKDLPFLAGLSDEVIMKWIPRTCHESCFHYQVMQNEHYQK